MGALPYSKGSVLEQDLESRAPTKSSNRTLNVLQCPIGKSNPPIGIKGHSYRKHKRYRNSLGDDRKV